MTAFLICKGTDTNNSDSFTILQLKGTKSSKICFQQTVKSLVRQHLSVLFRWHSAFLVPLEIHRADRHAVTVWVMSWAWQSGVSLSEALNCPSSSLSGHSANKEATWETSAWKLVGSSHLRFSKCHLLLCAARLSRRKRTEDSHVVRQRNGVHYIKTADDRGVTTNNNPVQEVTAGRSWSLHELFETTIIQQWS